MVTTSTLKAAAVNFLTQETFDHVRKDMQKGYSELADTNARIHGKLAAHFMYMGIIYPNCATRKVTAAPNLHSSLFIEMETIRGSLAEAGYVKVKNYFSAVLSASYGGVVLLELLPDILYLALKDNTSEEGFRALEHGDPRFPQSPEVVKAATDNIKEHYAEAITLLRGTLMDRLLLQGAR